MKQKPAINTDIPESLEPPKYSFKKYSNSPIGYFLTAAPILCGLALAGSIIPFFITTSIPWLMWLSSLTVLIPLVAVSAVVWAAIYATEIKNITAGMYWDDKITTHQFHDLYKAIASYKGHFKDATNDQVAKLVVKSFMVKSFELGDIKAKSENLTQYLNNLDETQDVLNDIKQIADLISKEDGAQLSDDAQLQGDIKNEYNKLKLNDKYPIQVTKNVFDIIGWINAILVNSVGVAISGLNVAAFACDLLFKIGIIASPIIPLAIAVTTTVACFIAGATAAAVLTRLKTRDVGENLAYSFWGWYESSINIGIFSTKHFDIFSTKNLVVFVAMLISLAVGIGFAGFNYYTGFYFGSMLVEILSGNMTNLIDPKYILDARNTNTLLGLSFALVGFALTIISTSSFLYGDVYKFINHDKKNQESFPETLLKLAKHFGAILLFTINMATIFVILFINLALLPMPLITVIALATITTIGLFINDTGILSAKNFKEYSRETIKLVTIAVMAFATAAMGAIGTSKVGSFWYTFLPAALATTSMLNIYGGIVFGAAIIAFPAVFSGAFKNIEKSFNGSGDSKDAMSFSKRLKCTDVGIQNIINEEISLTPQKT